MFGTWYCSKNPFEGKTSLSPIVDVWGLKECSLYSTFDLSKQRYEKGQKVRVREDAEAWGDFYYYPQYTEFRKHKGEICTIEGLAGSSYFVLFPDGFSSECPHEALDPVYEEPVEKKHIQGCKGDWYGLCVKGFNKEQWLKEGEENGMLKDGKVVV